MNSKNIFAVLNEDGVQNSYVFTCWDQYHAATFSPDVEIVAVRPLEVRGKNYRERKGYLRDLAVDVQTADNGGLSQFECAVLGDFFERNGRRYGLLTEFRENGIC